MHDYQHQFIEFALAQEVLRFGEFTLKSGRVSPYFFNAGLFNDGTALAQLGQFYAQTIVNSAVEFDALFGPAYKGIPLVSATSIAFAEHHQQQVPYSFNRKEAKDHGEGGLLVGADLNNKKVILIDDVITAGTAIREVLPILERAGATLAAIVVALDREEISTNQQSATGSLRDSLGIPVLSVIGFKDLLSYLETATDYQQHLPTMQNYREHYGV